MESFYGGKQGASFVIKAAFKYLTAEKNENNQYIDSGYALAIDSINAATYESDNDRQTAINNLNKNVMLECFKDSSYKDVWYGEYCIIDSPNKNNEHNGKIYRRTLKKLSDTINDSDTGGYADYIGQVVGPAGAALQIGNIKNTSAIQEMLDNLSLGQDDYLYFLRNNHGQPIEDHEKNPGDEIYINEFKGENSIKFIPGNTQNTEGSSLPGQYFQGENGDPDTYIHHGGYNWYYTTVQTENGEKSELFLGFDIPYHIIDISGARAIDFNQDPVVNYTKMGAFYDSYDLELPRGVHGGYFGNFHLERYNNATSYYKPTDIVYRVNDEQISEEETLFGDTYYISSDTDPIPTTSNDPDEITFTTNQLAWVGSFYWYTQPGTLMEIPNIFFGICKMVDSMELAADGYLTVTYSDAETVVINDDPITWINNVNLTNTGVLTVSYNNTSSIVPNQTPVLGTIAWINDMDLSNDGVVTVTFNATPAGFEDVGLSPTFGPITWVNNVALSEHGDLTVSYNRVPTAGENRAQTETIGQDIAWITGITLNDSNDGMLNVKFNTKPGGKIDEEDPWNPGNPYTEPLGPIVWINRMDLTEDGNLTVSYNTQNTVTINSTPVQWIKQIGIVPSGADKGQLYVIYNTDTVTPGTVTSSNYLGNVGYTEKGIFVQGIEPIDRGTSINTILNNMDNERAYVIPFKVKANNGQLPEEYDDSDKYDINSENYVIIKGSNPEELVLEKEVYYYNMQIRNWLLLGTLGEGGSGGGSNIEVTPAVTVTGALSMPWAV